MSSQLLGSFTLEDVADISAEDVAGLCSRVEDRLTVSSSSDQSPMDEMSKDETALLFILTSLMKSKCRDVEAAQIINNIFKHQQSAAHVSNFFTKVSAKFPVCAKNQL